VITEYRNVGQVRPGPFGVAVKGELLREQMRLRGLTGTALARATGLSDATISNALAGRRLHPMTFRKIAAHLAKVDPLPGAEALVEHHGLTRVGRVGDG
jgi:transcriptional regulator with XRE-family HTH domain